VRLDPDTVLPIGNSSQRCIDRQKTLSKEGDMMRRTQSYLDGQRYLGKQDALANRESAESLLRVATDNATADAYRDGFLEGLNVILALVNFAKGAKT
jgi:hypothetical protein